MEIVRSGFADDVDDGSGLAAEFGRVGSLLDVEFFDGVDRRGDHHVVEMLVGDGDAIHQIEIVAAALAEDIHQGSGLLQGVAARAAGRPHNAGAEHRQIQKLAALHGQILNLLAADDVADFGGG